MLLVIKKGKIMLITKQNPKGGPELKVHTIQLDESTGVYGYPLGYCPCGCGERLLVRTLDMREMVDKFGWSLTEHEETMAEVKRRLAPKLPFHLRLAKLLGGKVDE